jgi:hypothetical protein
METDPLPPLAKLETILRTDWLVSTLTQHGLGHYHEGAPLQDALLVGGRGEDQTWLAMADGVSSAPMSQHGSRAATAAVGHHLRTRLTAGAPANATLMAGAFAAAHEALCDAAKTASRQPNDYASTLAAVLISGNTVIAGSIGDSSVMAYSRHRQGSGFTPRLTPFCSAPQPPVRAVYAITHPHWREFATFRQSKSPHIQAIVLATDGATGFIQRDGDDPTSPPDPRYLDLVDGALRQLTPRRFCNFLASYLFETEADHFDDRSIILAWRLDGEARHA